MASFWGQPVVLLTGTPLNTNKHYEVKFCSDNVTSRTTPSSEKVCAKLTSESLRSTRPSDLKNGAKTNFVEQQQTKVAYQNKDGKRKKAMPEQKKSPEKAEQQSKVAGPLETAIRPEEAKTSEKFSDKQNRESWQSDVEEQASNVHNASLDLQPAYEAYYYEEWRKYYAEAYYKEQEKQMKLAEALINIESTKEESNPPGFTPPSSPEPVSFNGGVYYQDPSLSFSYSSTTCEQSIPTQQDVQDFHNDHFSQFGCQDFAVENSTAAQSRAPRNCFQQGPRDQPHYSGAPVCYDDQNRPSSSNRRHSERPSYRAEHKYRTELEYSERRQPPYSSHDSYRDHGSYGWTAHRPIVSPHDRGSSNAADKYRTELEGSELRQPFYSSHDSYRDHGSYDWTARQPVISPQKSGSGTAFDNYRTEMEGLDRRQPSYSFHDSHRDHGSYDWTARQPVISPQESGSDTAFDKYRTEMEGSERRQPSYSSHESYRDHGSYDWAARQPVISPQESGSGTVSDTVNNCYRRSLESDDYYQRIKVPVYKPASDVERRAIPNNVPISDPSAFKIARCERLHLAKVWSCYWAKCWESLETSRWAGYREGALDNLRKSRSEAQRKVDQESLKYFNYEYETACSRDLAMFRAMEREAMDDYEDTVRDLLTMVVDRVVIDNVPSLPHLLQERDESFKRITWKAASDFGGAARMRYSYDETPMEESRRSQSSHGHRHFDSRYSNERYDRQGSYRSSRNNSRRSSRNSRPYYSEAKYYSGSSHSQSHRYAPPPRSDYRHSASCFYNI